MAKGRKARKPQTFIEKVEHAYPGYTNDVVGLSVQQLEKRIADMQKELEDTRAHEQANDKLTQAKAEVDMLSGGYKDVKKAVTMKTRLLVTLIREKGGA